MQINTSGGCCRLFMSVSNKRTRSYDVRYTREKLPLPWRKGRVERDSWDTSLFKTTTLGRQFLRSHELSRVRA